ncbi:HBL398Wp [Eremothecium sinecaudum]|uniref:HBL398Wp n=1 Tax=Eremothecium sinecaudum TaxID=45286 RepID=A0A109UVY1_9SACH|nr:HBL398Wp [Eremothecium sinecaudum]AMD18504.1 HBL398Wp [Eremothecium sinecaudum]
MDIIDRCKLYPLDKFFRPTRCSLSWLTALSATDRLKEIRFLHVIETSIGLITSWKQLLLDQLLSREPPGAVLIIDAISVWSEAARKATNKDRVHYINNPSLLQFAGIVGFLAQLNESPEMTVKSRCESSASINLPLTTIIIDNLSIYNYQEGLNLIALRKMFDTLHETFGCVIITFGYGIEYYEGVENSFPANSSELKGPWPTRLDQAYLKSMDSVLALSEDPRR